MIDRFLQVTLLLRSLNDLRFEPVTWSAQLRRQAVAGEGPSERMECSSCKGEGLVRRRGISVACEAEGCGGRGWLFVDAYTRRPIGSAETGTSREVRAVRCDGCGGQGAHGNGRRCGYCGGSGQREVSPALRMVRVGPVGGMLEWGPGELPLASALDEGFRGAGRAYGDRVRAGSYEELEAGLLGLRAVDRARYRLVCDVYVDSGREPEDLSVASQASLRLGVVFLAASMPEVIRVPGWAARNERRRRERLKRSGVAA